MKALSIIALAVCVLAILFSFAIMNFRTEHCIGDQSYYGIDKTTFLLGFLTLILNLFLLAYAIVGTVKAFKKNKKAEATS